MNTEIPLCPPYYFSTTEEFPRLSLLESSVHTVGKGYFAEHFHLRDILTRKSTVLNLRRLFIGNTKYRYGVKFNIVESNKDYWKRNSYTYYVNKGVILNSSGDPIAVLRDGVLYLYDSYEFSMKNVGVEGLFKRLSKMYPVKYMESSELKKFFKMVLPRPKFRTMSEAFNYAKQLSIEMMQSQPDKFIIEDVEIRADAPF